ncbi:MAG TPA: carbohydrate binding family 9 domain-containing protein [Acidobacteriota bacterium]
MRLTAALGLGLPLCAGLALLFGCALAAPASELDNTITAAHPSGFIRLDGRLDEAAWLDATVVELVQQSPHPGQPHPYKTEVRILIKGDDLYFGFSCTDPNPEKIAIHTMQRDANIRGDDSVSIVLDTYGDKRTGYFFQVNAAGARVDGLINGPDNPSFDWDGIWDARTARTKTGWSAEIVIPSRTLSFTSGLKSWGLNLERFIARDRITLRWASPTLDSFLYDLSRAGSLTGVESLKQGFGIEVSPYTAGRMKELFGKSERAWQGTGGLDATWRMTPQLAVVFTANTDFAETEVDSRQINVTRFPLFFPEKRSFFLEGANQFVFGLNLADNFIPFFTRRVGLLEEQQVPIDGGIKLNGRAGRWNLALLDVQMRETGTAPGVNLFASRVSYDLTNKFRVGTIVTSGDPAGLTRNRLAGLDAVWRTSTFLGNKNLLIGGWTAASAGDLPSGQRSGWGLAADFPNDLLDCSASINEFGDALTPALGFLPRPGTRRYNLGCAYQPRPSKDTPLGWIRQEFFENFYTRVDDLNGITQSWRYFMAPFNVRTESGEHLEFNWAPQYEFLPEPFEIAGVVIPSGAYRFTRWRIEAQSSDHRPLQVGSTTWFGEFYNGHLTQWENYLRWNSPTGHWLLGLTAENNFGRLKEGSFVQRLWQLQSALAWSPNLVFTSFIQYDSESQNLGMNTRLRWTIKPGNDLFIVWNRGWQRLITSRDELRVIPDTELIALKLRWTFRR